MRRRGGWMEGGGNRERAAERTRLGVAARHNHRTARVWQLPGPARAEQAWPLSRDDVRAAVALKRGRRPGRRGVRLIHKLQHCAERKLARRLRVVGDDGSGGSTLRGVPDRAGWVCGGREWVSASFGRIETPAAGNERRTPTRGLRWFGESSETVPAPPVERRKLRLR